MNKCLNPQCDNMTRNPKFCSRSCSASVTNSTNPRKKKKQRLCSCGQEIAKPRGIYCSTCLISRKKSQESQSLGQQWVKVYNQPTSGFRYQARKSYKDSGKPMSCLNCGYNKHVQICHILSVREFPTDTPVSVVNDPGNLIALCPNCHWELDHGMLLLKDIPCQGERI